MVFPSLPRDLACIVSLSFTACLSVWLLGPGLFPLPDSASATLWMSVLATAVSGDCR